MCRWLRFANHLRWLRGVAGGCTGLHGVTLHTRFGFVLRNPAPLRPKPTDCNPWAFARSSQSERNSPEVGFVLNNHPITATFRDIPRHSATYRATHRINDQLRFRNTMISHTRSPSRRESPDDDVPPQAPTPTSCYGPGVTGFHKNSATLDAPRSHISECVPTPADPRTAHRPIGTRTRPA